MEAHPRLNERLFHGLFGKHIATYDDISCGMLAERQGPQGNFVLLPIIIKDAPNASIQEIHTTIKQFKGGSASSTYLVEDFEKKFVRDEELQFKIQGRSNKYLAEFVLEKLDKSEDEKQKYIQEIIKADMEEAGTEDVFRKIKKDFREASVSIEDREIREQMEKALSRAKEDFK